MAHPLTPTADAPDAATLRRFRRWLATFEPPAAPPSPALAGDPEPTVPSLAPPLRPAPTPTCAGLTPGFEHLVTEVRRRGRARALARSLDADGDLAAAIEGLFVELAALRAERPEGGGRG